MSGKVLRVGAVSALLGSLVLLGGCLSVLPEPDVPRALVSLPTEGARRPEAPLLTDIGIYSPDSARTWSGADMAVRDGGEIVYLSGVRWADSATRLLQGAVLDALAGAPGGGRAIPVQLGARVDYEVRWRIVDLSIGPRKSQAVAIADVSLVNARSGRITAQTRVEATATPAANTPNARGAALAAAAQSIANATAAFVAVNAVPLAVPPGEPAVASPGAGAVQGGPTPLP